MKKIFKKNQVIVTALAIMIAIAGYLNYSQSNLGNQNFGDEAAKEVAGENDEINPASDEILAEDELLQSDNDIESLDAEEETDADVESTEEFQDVADAESTEIENDGGTEMDTPGEAMLVSSISGTSFAARAKLNREQVRAANKQTLQEIIDNTNLADGVKQEAVDKLVEITQIAEKESAAETMLAAKGFEDCVVTITDDKVDVAVGMSEISDSQRAQIEDVVKRKTEIEASGIYITPVTE